MNSYVQLDLFDKTTFPDYDYWEDCFGFERHEGDVVRIDTMIDYCLWDEEFGEWILDLSFHKDQSLSSSLSVEIKDFEYEITGNIHEKNT